MKKYLYDLHIHTSESSACGETCAADIVARYKGLGYDGIVITDHVGESALRNRGETYDEKITEVLKGYRAAKALEDENFTVILGMELRFRENDNDYLVYGIDEDFLRRVNLTEFEKPADFVAVAKENNLAFFQAHPFRDGMTVLNPIILDGVEVYNGHGGHDSRNDIALAWAKKFGVRMISGSDFHYVSKAEPGGVYFEERHMDSKAVAKALLENRYTLK